VRTDHPHDPRYPLRGRGRGRPGWRTPRNQRDQLRQPRHRSPGRARPRRQRSTRRGQTSRARPCAALRPRHPLL